MKLGESGGGTYSSSSILRKAHELGLELPDDLSKLAVVRGLRYYDGRNEGPEWRKESRLQVSIDDFSNTELAIALLSPDLPDDNKSELQVRQRIASAVLSADGVDPEELCQLAKQEKCESILHWIATCGAEVEPDHGFWRKVLGYLPESKKPDGAPHPTRFYALSGIVNGKKQNLKQWVRLTVEDVNGKS